MNFSYSKDFRLKSSKQYQQVLERSKALRGKFLTLYAYTASNYPFTKIGIVASRKYGKAVARNRFKRIVREAFRRVKPSFPCGAQIVVKPRKTALQAQMHDVIDELLVCIESIKGRE